MPSGTSLIHRPGPRFAVGLALLCGWVLATTLLMLQPVTSLGALRGLYREPDAASSFQWTSSQVVIPLRSASGATLLALTVGNYHWPGRRETTVSLRAEPRELIAFAAPDAKRIYRILVPVGSSQLTFHSTVDQPSPVDSRRLGVQLYGVAGQATGFPLHALGLGLLLEVGAGLACVGLWWCSRSDIAGIALLTLAALAIRLFQLGTAPPGFSQDEAISLVDAWHIAQTGRDHLGHFLPLGAQEALGDWISPLLTYLELPLVAVFGPERLVGRFVTALVGALMVPLCYWLLLELKLSRLAAFAAAGIVALSPWLIFLSRFALPPALAPTAWVLALLAGVRFVDYGSRRSALVFAASLGVGLYAYPTLKLALPMLAGVAVLLALRRHGWGAARRWLVAAGALVLLWLPFVAVTLFNPLSSTRLSQTLVRADSPLAWLGTVARNYSQYFNPSFYLRGDGDPIHMVPGFGMTYPAELPFALLGILVIVWQLARWHQRIGTAEHASGWWLLAIALVLAPLPASLNQPSPHAFRAALIAPCYALLIGCAVAAIQHWVAPVSLLLKRVAGALAVCAVLLAVVQAGAWYRAYLLDYPASVATVNQDGLLEAVERAAIAAPVDQTVWVETQDIAAPAVYVLAARALSARAAQATMIVTRQAGHLNTVVQIGRFHFGTPTEAQRVQTLEAVPTESGGPGFVVEVWQTATGRQLVVRRMA